MKVYDENGKELKNPDLSLGFLADSMRLVAHHEAINASPEQGHMEVMEGTDGLRRFVVDKPAISASPAWDEYEPCEVYKKYTEEELAEMNKPSDSQRLDAVEEAILDLMMGGI